ncbi:hypothetical protein CYLTODRAFT_426364 [Cylindrobasidium torrendii FP15055 ss-10]|uniref:F-box domain-containing protein n=1 Tax=Cylindrobasidium torrendii FP15055 ss-10 TaxID=1314674 RepID=A0A0D7B0T3_9AGAR|nr:hypothetical protein CYLTODRAFT_426364 [Cylindrobasidium torrendii FP15055 ss-10]
MAMIPLELLRHIFYHACLPTHNEETHVYEMFIGHNDRPMQHILPQVCRRWHNTAYTSSRLWSNLCIIWPPNVLGAVDVERVQGIVQRVVQRSGTAPLDIILLGNAWDKVAHCFIPEAHRWRALFVSHPFSAQQISEYRSLQDKLPSLEGLAFGPTPLPNVPPETLEEYANALSLMLSNAPRLRRLSGHHDLLTLPFPWKQIAELKIVGLPADPDSPSRFQSEDLKNCISVRVLIILGVAPKDNTNICMPSVQELHCPADANFWIGCLILPALRTLSISVNALHGLPGLIGRSGCQLSTLRIHIAPQDDSTVLALRAILAELPHLECTKLYLSERASPLRIVPRLASILDPVANGKALPVLAEFHLALVHTSEVDEETELMLRTALAVTESVLRPTMRFASVSLENARSRGGSLDEQVVLGLTEFVKLQLRARSEGVLTRVQLILSTPAKLSMDGGRVLMDSYLH